MQVVIHFFLQSHCLSSLWATSLLLFPSEGLFSHSHLSPLMNSCPWSHIFPLCWGHEMQYSLLPSMRPSERAGDVREQQDRERSWCVQWQGLKENFSLGRKVGGAYQMYSWCNCCQGRLGTFDKWPWELEQSESLCVFVCLNVLAFILIFLHSNISLYFFQESHMIICDNQHKLCHVDPTISVYTEMFLTKDS